MEGTYVSRPSIQKSQPVTVRPGASRVRASRVGRSARPRRLGRMPRPDRFLGPVVSAIFLLFAFAAVAHASGSGWVQAVGAVTAGLAFVGMIGPALTVSRLTVHCVRAPRDATRGEEFEIEVVANHPLRCTPSRPRGPGAVLGSSGPRTVTITPPHRGMLTSVRVRLATAAPLGLLCWSVERHVMLPTSVAVSPCIARMARPPCFTMATTRPSASSRS